MIKQLVSGILLCSSFYSYANLELCRENVSAVTYGDAIRTQKAGNVKEAFSKYCNLAFAGDYRSQFKMAQYYTGDIQTNFNNNYELAWVWASLSNGHVISANRSRFIEALEKKLSQEQLNQAKALLIESKEIVKTGIRIDQEMKPVDLFKIMKQYQKRTAKKAYTGSRIKKDEAPSNVDTIGY